MTARSACPPSPRASLPSPGVTRQRVMSLHHLGDRCVTVFALTGSCAESIALLSALLYARPSGLCRLLSAPAGHRSFPTISLRIFPQMPGPLLRRSQEAHMPVSSSLSSAFPNGRLGRLPATIREHSATFSKLQTFRYVQASEFAHLPGRSYRCAQMGAQGSRGLYVRAYRASLPLHAPDMLAARSQAIGGVGTFTRADSQPCRLLPPMCSCVAGSVGSAI